MYSPRGVLPLFRCVFSFSPLQLTRPWLRSADTGLWARAGVSVRGGVVVDVSKGATRTAVLRAWPGIRAWLADVHVGSRMCTWGWGSPCGLAHVRASLWISLWSCACARESGGLLVGLRMCARVWGSPCGLADVHVSPFTGSSNPFMRSWTLLMALWAACLDCHLWG